MMCSGMVPTAHPERESFRPVSDEQGVIAALCGETGKPLARCDTREAESPPVNGRWCWVHLDYNRPATHEWLRTASGIPNHGVSAMLAEHTRPRTTRFDGGVLFIGRGIAPDPDADPEDTVSIRAWITEHRLITVVMSRVIGTEEMLAKLEAGAAVSGPAEILSAIVSFMIDRVTGAVEDISDTFDEMNQRVIDEAIDITTAEMAPARVRAIVLHRYLAPLRGALLDLVNLDLPWVDAPTRSRFREAHDRISRLVEDLESALHRAAVARDEIVSQGTEKLNRRLYALTVLAAVFLPLTFGAGLLGMNVADIPGSTHPNGFAVICIVFVLAIVAEVIVLKLLRWL